MFWIAVEHVIFDQNRMAMLAEMIEMHIEKYFKEGYGIRELDKSLL